MVKKSDCASAAGRREHWDTYNPVNDKLAGIVGPLALGAAEAAFDDSERTRTMCNTYRLPYGKMSKLPPALFGTITKESFSIDRPLTIPTDDQTIAEMADSYFAWATRLAQTGDYSYVSVPDTITLVDTMSQLKGQEYPVDEWTAAAQVTQEALKNEPLFTIDIHRLNQVNGDAYSLDELPPDIRPLYRQHSMYTLAISQLAPEDERTPSVRELVQIPIGEYGQEAAERLARTVVELGDFIRTSSEIDELIAGITADEEIKDFLRKHTIRTRQSYERGEKNHIKIGTSDALIGGLLSMTQVISFLTAEKVKGYDNFDELVDDILDSEVLEYFARIVPVGYIGPVTLGGLYIPNALDTTGASFSLSREVDAHLSEMRREYFLDMVEKWKKYNEDPENNEMPDSLGLSCPASEPDGAIAALKPLLKAYLEVSTEASSN